MTLSTYLKSTGETQKQFAERIGVTQAFVSKLCGVDPKLSLETALTIEAATGGQIRIEMWPQFRALAGRITDRNAPVATQGAAE